MEEPEHRSRGTVTKEDSEDTGTASRTLWKRQELHRKWHKGMDLISRNVLDRQGWVSNTDISEENGKGRKSSSPKFSNRVSSVLTTADRGTTDGQKETFERLPREKRWQMLVDERPPSYDAAYWEDRYLSQSGKTFDWYMDLWRIRSLFIQKISEATDDTTLLSAAEHVRPSKDDLELLVLGNGNSEVPEKLWQEGYKNITAIDTCAIVVEMMARRLAKYSEIEFIRMDAQNLAFPNNSFSCVIEKATLDLVLAAEEDWAVGIQKVQTILLEVLRVLKPGGMFLSVSNISTRGRLPLLSLNDSAPWRIEVVRLTKPSVPFLTDTNPLGATPAEENYYYLYICTIPTVVQQKTLHLDRVGVN